jgi:2-polyprenyl-3-methyl-5-hydroxy-6-metoxy-1,4-benzoquinol methylase
MQTRRREQNPRAYWSGVESDPHVKPNPPVELNALLDMVGDSSVLDFGCGFGRLADHFKDYLGVDIANHRIEIAKRIYPDKEFRYVADVRELDGFGGVRDVAICCDVLLHIPDDDIAMVVSTLARSARRVVVAEHLGRDWRGPDFHREKTEYEEIFGLVGLMPGRTREVLNPRYGEFLTVMEFDEP